MSYIGVIQKAEIVVSDSHSAALRGKLLSANCGGGKCFFNPSEFSITRDVTYAEHKIPGLGRPIAQFMSGGAEVMKFALLFDTFSAGAETRNLKQTGASKLPETVKFDVRDFTKPIVKLMEIADDLHVPPMVSFKWGKILFDGYMVSIAEKFTMFNSIGTPVRSVLDITLRSSTTDDQVRNSPDRTKHKIVTEGDRLYAYAHEEYGSCGDWRYIAEANGIENPRLLQSGKAILIPPI